MAIDITTGKFHESGWKYLTFKEIGAAAGVQQLVSKDVTNGSQKFLIAKVILSCLTGYVKIFDGTAGGTVPIFSLYCNSDNNNSQTWDFQGDPVELTRDGTDLCISAAGTFDGFVKYGWGA